MGQHKVTATLTAPAAAQTPDEWLLEQFEKDFDTWGDCDRDRDRSVQHVRPIFQVLDDHATDDCQPGPHSDNCRYWSSPGVWPDPRPHHHLVRYGDSDEFAALARRARADIDADSTAGTR